MLFVLDSALLTSFGVYKYQMISVDEAKQYLRDNFVSAVGHFTTAEFLTELLGIKIKYNRIQIRMEKGDKAIVFKLFTRLPSYVKLTDEEIRSIPYQLGLMERLE